MPLSKLLKVFLFVIGSLAAVVVALIFTVVILRSIPFPIQELSVTDALLGVDYSGHTSNAGNVINGFSVRITNNSSIQVGRILYRIDIYDENGKPIDGAVAKLHGPIPGHSTRKVHEQYIGFDSLPDNGKWSWSGNIVGAYRFYLGW